MKTFTSLRFVIISQIFRFLTLTCYSKLNELDAFYKLNNCITTIVNNINFNIGITITGWYKKKSHEK